MKGGAVATMLQVQYSKYHGGSQALEMVEVEVPAAGRGEVVVRVEASGVNPVDWRIQDGLAKHLLPRRFPFVPGTDVAAEVVALGPGVTGLALGDKVVTYLHVLKGGALAEFAVAQATRTVARPRGVSAAEGACAVVAGYTALQSARQAGIKSFAGGSERVNVLIAGAAGGVGVLLVQLVKLAGAHVTATCGAERNMALLRGLGADEVLDYHSPEGTAWASPSGRRYHVVLNCAHFVPPEAFAARLHRSARVVHLTPCVASILAAARNRVWLAVGRALYRFENFYMADTREDLETMMGLMRVGKVRAVVDSCFPLRRAGDAWERSMARHCSGKIIVVCNDVSENKSSTGH